MYVVAYQRKFANTKFNTNFDGLDVTQYLSILRKRIIIRFIL